MRGSTAFSLPALRGGLLALLAAVLFGASTPLVQRFGAGVGTFTTAALLYAGAAVVGALSRQKVEREARVVAGDLPRLLAMAGFGAVLGPVALAWGLQHTSGTGASLMLTLEALFTVLLAWRLYHETMGRRVWAAMLLLLAGGALLVLDQGRSGGGQVLGLLAVLVATLAWGVDNTLSRALAERDPSQVVMAKATIGAGVTLLLAWAAGESLPDTRRAMGLLLVGASGYGLSLRLYLLAQRAFGAARTGSVFAFAPFIGAALAVALGERSPGALMAVGSALMLAGVVLHLGESHGHEHGHEAIEHEHAHRHDDGHHDHAHDAMPAGAHSHAHRASSGEACASACAGCASCASALRRVRSRSDGGRTRCVPAPSCFGFRFGLCFRFVFAASSSTEMAYRQHCRVPPRRAGNFLLVAQKKVTKEEGLNATPHAFCMLRTPGPAGYWCTDRKIAQPARWPVTGSLRFALGRRHAGAGARRCGSVRNVMSAAPRLSARRRRAASRNGRAGSWCDVPRWLSSSPLGRACGAGRTSVGWRSGPLLS